MSNPIGAITPSVANSVTVESTNDADMASISAAGASLDALGNSALQNAESGTVQGALMAQAQQMQEDIESQALSDEMKAKKDDIMNALKNMA